MMLTGFSKLNPSEKLNRMLREEVISAGLHDRLQASWSPTEAERGMIERMTENVVSLFALPYSIAPGFLINGRECAVPMVTEESSVVAAASWAARYWAARGGFSTHVVSESKIGQIHFIWPGDPKVLTGSGPDLFEFLHLSVSDRTASMKRRGGGITGMEILDLTDRLPGYYQIRVTFLTADSMGANFINGCLEEMSRALMDYAGNHFDGEHRPEVILSILSNHTPDCRVVCSVECPIAQLNDIKNSSDPNDFARRFALAVRIASIDPYRAVTHNKGIYNGIDAVVMATANDFRAVEAAGHAWASRSGSYSSLTTLSLDQGIFRYTLEVPIAVGTIGGLTRTHPMASASLEIMGNPSAADLMQIAAAAGMANNFAAIKALITTGIQAGHMPLHHRKHQT